MASSEELVAVHMDGRTYSFARSDSEARSIYGGPQERTLKGARFGPARLHHIATLTSGSLPQLGAPKYIFSVPLVYGFRFEGCELEYVFDTNEIDVRRIAPHESSEEWPYPDYPPLLPYLPIDVVSDQIEDWDTFSARFPNLPEAQPAELVAVVPPPLEIGQSLWGRSGLPPLSRTLRLGANMSREVANGTSVVHGRVQAGGSSSSG